MDDGAGPSRRASAPAPAMIGFIAHSDTLVRPADAPPPLASAPGQVAALSRGSAGAAGDLPTAAVLATGAGGGRARRSRWPPYRPADP